MPQITTDPLLRLAVLATGLVVLLGLPMWGNEAVAEETEFVRIVGPDDLR